ncbi:SRPBCC family protein [Streptacidiphilus fuscans]|uniref:Uncharacterized protein n=1 Tax=Streptacidiphilus fuscans TaxID=2789292 RepID=A0A931B0X5_9ACTN|nr:hypothetical protein [Streptacidiphilus fuscans]MBF9069130.1 hypothetical protein [Streptacidiphilus fuscans]
MAITVERSFVVGTPAATVTLYLAATDQIAVRPQGSGSLITYRAILRFNGVFRLAEPLLRSSFDELADAVQVRLTQVLHALPARGTVK